MNDYKRIERAIVFIEEHALEQPSLADIARHIGISEFHFQRMFKRWAGISPKRFVQYLTAKRCGDLLRNEDSVLDAALDAGLSGSNRLHELMVNVYAMTPQSYRNQGQSIQIEYGWHPTPFGYCLLATTEMGVCWLSFHDDQSGIHELKSEWQAASFVENSKVTGNIVRQIFEGIYHEPQKIMLHVKGTNLQIRVWEALLGIESANDASYSEIARQVDRPQAVRAVASAVARNPVSFVIPCHRVIRKSGALGGYRWGLARKQVLRAWESAQGFASESKLDQAVNLD